MSGKRCCTCRQHGDREWIMGCGEVIKGDANKYGFPDGFIYCPRCGFVMAWCDDLVKTKDKQE